MGGLLLVSDVTNRRREGCHEMRVLMLCRFLE